MDTPRRHLLVDGHNVLHAWGWMADGESTARTRLIEALRVVQDTDSIAVTIVFDSRDAQTAIDPATTATGFVVKYASAGLTADGEIERMVVGDAAPQRYIVVTGDGTIAGNVRAAGGEAMSPEGFGEWIDRCQSRARRALRVRQAKHKEKFGNRLPL